MLSWFERLIDPFKEVPVQQPPSKLGAFYWHFLRQVWWVYALIMLFGLLGALIEVSLFAFVGKIVDLAKSAKDPASFFEEHGTTLIWMAFVALVARPVAFGMHALLINQTANANVMGMVRWQQHRYMLRQSLSFFQNDFAGRLANKIMQTGGALRQTVLEIVDALWFVAIYWTSAAIIFFDLDWRLVIPLILWMLTFLGTMWFFVPRLIHMATIVSDARSMLTGRIVDSYTNILTVKLFAHTEGEDGYAKEAISDHLNKLKKQLRWITGMEMSPVGADGFAYHRHHRACALALDAGLHHAWRNRSDYRTCDPHQQHGRLDHVGGNVDFREYRHRAGRHGGDFETLDRRRRAGSQALASLERRNPL